MLKDAPYTSKLNLIWSSISVLCSLYSNRSFKEELNLPRGLRCSAVVCDAETSWWALWSQGRCGSSLFKAQDLGTWLPALCRQTDLEREQELPFWRVVTEQLWLLPSDCQRLFLELGTYTSISPCKHSQDKKAVPGYKQQPACQGCLWH